MFLHAQWVGPSAAGHKATRIRTPFGIYDLLGRQFSGFEELAIVFNTFEQRAYGAPWPILAITEHIGALAGSETKLSIVPVPESWAGPAVLRIFEDAGFRACAHARTIELKADSDPGTAISVAAVICFALDPYARAQPELLEKARAMAIRLDLSESVVGLLDGYRGLARLRNILGESVLRCDVAGIEKEIAAILRRIQTKVLVHFQPEGGGLLRAVAREYPLHRAIGVESSLVRAGHRISGVELVHGTLVEGGQRIPHESTALIVDALPPEGDLRLDRAAEMLFGQIAFESVIFVDRWPNLGKWVSTEAAKRGYRACPPWLVGESTAIVCRRDHLISPDPHPRSHPSRKVPTHSTRTVEVDGYARTLEAFSRFTVDPRWMIYLPPELTTLPSDLLDEELEHPRSVLAYYQNEGVSKLVTEVYEPSSRVVVIVCRDEAVGKERFGISTLGCVYTEKGHPFGDDSAQFLAELRDGLTRADFWSRFKTDWVCLDGNMLPWSKGKERQVRENKERILAGEAKYGLASQVLMGFAESDQSAGHSSLSRYRRLCEDLFAPQPVSFNPEHLLATEGRSYFGMTQLWHMETLSALGRRAGPPFRETRHRLFDVSNHAATEELITWWRAMPGLILRTLPFLPKGRRGQAQSAFLCRGAEHLRLIYGPEYDRVENRIWIRDRLSAVNRKAQRRRILKQQALGMEAVRRFIAREPVQRIEECVRGVLAVD